MNSNPLLDFSGLPRYSAVRPEHIAPAIEQLLAQGRDLVSSQVAPAVPASWEDFVAPLDDEGERLSRAWGMVGHLHSVLDSPELREAYNAVQPKVVEYFTELGQNQALFEKYKALRASGAFDALSAAQRKIIDNEIRDFKLSGAELAEQARQRYAAIMQQLAALSTRFSENLLDATNAFKLNLTDQSELDGVPEDVKAAAREAAEEDGQQGWTLTMRAPCYFPVMQYAKNRALREKLYYAHETRASEFGPANLDNTPLMSDILKLRREAAQLLGYASHAEVSLASKMADTPRQVIEFLDELAAKAKPYAERDVDELKRFAAEKLGLADLQSWDVAYASEQLRIQRYAFSDQEVKQYFPEEKVLSGMFRVVEKIFGVHIRPDQADTWDPAVRFFRIEDGEGRITGRFYLDPYARASKRGGAWMDEALTRRRRAGEVQPPVAHLVCNFSAPVGNRPALLTHDEVITLFHEFGHGLHHLLTQVDYQGVSGINGVEWDAVELPSQFMENFCWEWEVMQGMSAHVDTAASLPRALFDKMIAAKNFQSGMQMVRQIEFSLFDMHLHHDFDPSGAVSGATTPQQLLEQVRKRVAVFFPPPFNRFANGFSHIFGGGYSAGYYSYKWAEVLSADAFGAFEEAAKAEGQVQHSILDPEVGAKFRDEILAVGGSRPAMDSFKAFRGRAPSIEALLRHSGMISPSILA
jgi:oligopeptidase A